MQTVYEAAGGADGLLRLANAWHARVMADEVVSHAFSHGFHPEHNQRLAAYWAEALGGPTTYSERYGDQTSVVRLHSGNGPHQEMDRRAIDCFAIKRSSTSAATNGSDRYYTTTSPGQPLPRCLATTGPPRRSRTDYPSHSGRGMDSSTDDGRHP